MVLGLISAIAACPAIIGTTEGVRHGQSANAKERHRGQKVNLRVRLPKRNAYSSKFDDALIVLKDNKLYIQHADSKFDPDEIHPFLGYYLPYPANQVKWKTAGWKGEGLVSTINEDNMLNWIYVCYETYEVKYGIRAIAEENSNLVGPWDCTNIDKRLTFEGWEGFLAVQEDPDPEKDLWALYFDRGDNGLDEDGLIGSTGVNGKPVRMLEVQLMRTEKEKTKEMAIEERVDRLRAMAGKAKKEQEEAVHGNTSGSDSS